MCFLFCLSSWSVLPCCIFPIWLTVWQSLKCLFTLWCNKHTIWQTRCPSLNHNRPDLGFQEQAWFYWRRTWWWLGKQSWTSIESSGGRRIQRSTVEKYSSRSCVVMEISLRNQKSKYQSRVVTSRNLNSLDPDLYLDLHQIAHTNKYPSPEWTMDSFLTYIASFHQVS